MDLAEAKALAPDFLLGLGLREATRGGVPRVEIPYHDADGRQIAVRYRHALTGSGRFSYRRGDRPQLYGLDRLAASRDQGWVLLVEGESDCWTAWHNGLPALGIPGKGTWRSDWARYVAGLAVFLWQEPGAEDLAQRVGRDVPELRVIVAPEDFGDLSEAHVADQDVRVLVHQLRQQALTIAELALPERRRRLGELRARAQPVFEADDPMTLVETELRRLGYGGDLRPALLVYLSATSRVLAMREGTMPVHLELLGPPSSGKSYTVNLTLRLLPAEAHHTIDAGSPRVLIYDTAELQHRVVVFGEADSLPAGEDNPAASAIRNLLQDNRLHYKVVEREESTGKHAVRQIQKPGPTVVITTSTRHLGDQLESRMFVLEIPADTAQIRAQLAEQGRLEQEGVIEPDDGLVAYQAYLQDKAPWHVEVPFVRALAAEIARAPSDPRINRDFARLVSLVKAVAVMRQTRRHPQVGSRIVAEIDDYAYVYNLVESVYAETVSGVSDNVRLVVATVSRLVEGRDRGDDDPVTERLVADETDLPKTTCRRAIHRALSQGWLVNRQERRGRPADLALGEPLPPVAGLPAPEVLSAPPDAGPAR